MHLQAMVGEGMKDVEYGVSKVIEECCRYLNDGLKGGLNSKHLIPILIMAYSLIGSSSLSSSSSSSSSPSVEELTKRFSLSDNFMLRLDQIGGSRELIHPLFQDLTSPHSLTHSLTHSFTHSRKGSHITHSI